MDGAGFRRFLCFYVERMKNGMNGFEIRPKPADREGSQHGSQIQKGLIAMALSRQRSGSAKASIRALALPFVGKFGALSSLLIPTNITGKSAG